MSAIFALHPHLSLYPESRRPPIQHRPTIMKEILAVIIAFGIGAACGRFAIPLPAPPHWIGVALIAAIWLGYTLFKQPA
jgi:XapX domain-containing protein